jgi:F-type H+-transporting ATPase subunit b
MNLPIASSGSFLITPNVGLMVWVLVVFLVCFLILRKAVFPRIGELLDRRAATIDESIDSAAKLRDDAEKVLAEYRERLAEARAQADEIVTRARQAGDAHQKEAVEAARAERERLIEQTRRDVEAETRRAIDEIRREVADLTVLATEKVTRKALTDEDQKRLVEDALAELDFSALTGGSKSCRPAGRHSGDSYGRDRRGLRALAVRGRDRAGQGRFDPRAARTVRRRPHCQP